MIFNKRFGSYRLVRKVAVGGMAEVFVGLREGPPPFARLVALKTMLAHLARDRANVEMFYREARIGGLLRHPNVVQVYDAAEIDGRHTMVMEYVAGQTADELMARLEESGAKPDPYMALRIVSDAALGLHHAHELRGMDGSPLQLVHRDISPHNLLVGYDGQVKVFDFGVAVGGASDQGQGQLAGKAAYMSPEQCRGRAVDRRSDIFSLGIVLHELLTMKRLFKRENHISSIRAITEEAIPRPGQLVEGLSPEIDAIVMKALNRDSDERFQTALDLHHAIEACLAHAGAVAGREELASLMEDQFRNEMSEAQVVVQKILLAPAPSESSIDLASFEHDAKTVVAAPQVFSEEGRGFERMAEGEGADGEEENRRQAEDFFAARAEAALSRKLKTARVLNALLLLLALVGLAFGAWTFMQPEGTSVVETTAGPDFLLLTVETEPPGATLVLAGEEHPVVTPTMVMVPRQRPAALELRLAGYQPATLRIDPTETEEATRTLRQELEIDPASPEAPIGNVRVVYEPADAILYIDNERVADASPAMLDGLRLNHEYNVRLQKGGFETLVFPLTLTSGEMLQLELELSEMLELAQLTIRTNPTNASVSINGEAVGTSPLDIDLPTNETYFVEVARAGFQPIRRSITHTRDRALTIDLQRVGAPSPQPATRPTPAPTPAPAAPADDDYPILLD